MLNLLLVDLLKAQSLELNANNFFTPKDRFYFLPFLINAFFRNLGFSPSKKQTINCKLLSGAKAPVPKIIHYYLLLSMALLLKSKIKNFHHLDNTILHSILDIYCPSKNL